MRYDDDDDDLLRDGERLHVGMPFMDSLQRDIATTTTTQQRVVDAFGHSDHFALGRPGPRYGVGRRYGDDERAAAYRDVALRDSNAWRSPPPVVPTRDAAPPDGAYPLSAGEGTACTINGAPGTLERDGEWLVCVPVADMTDAREAAYDEVALRDEHAWKNAHDDAVAMTTATTMIAPLP
jgi:hypothetical protein